MADVNLPLSGPVIQSFFPVTVNVGTSSDPAMEEKIIKGVASYGKQLGRIGDALLVLLKHLPAETSFSDEDKEAIHSLERMLAEVAVKKKRRTAG